ncbi:MAG: Sec-independent protein translocase protein TatB [Pseudomonadota bacterium]
MFGISFGELLLIGLIALLVLGPERLPGAARTAGLWIGRLKRSFNAIKQEVEREIGADEIRRQLHNENIMSLEQETQDLFTPFKPASSVRAPLAPVPAAQVGAASPTVAAAPAADVQAPDNVSPPPSAPQQRTP